MKILADTHALVWAIDSPELLSRKARAAINGGELLFSVISLWELILKRTKKNALLVDPSPWWGRHVVRGGFDVLAVRSEHVLALDHLPEIHGDPFDRMLVAQAMVEGAAIVTVDGDIKAYDVRVIW